MEERITRLRNLLTEQNLDAVLISSPTNIVYFSGFSGFSSVERDGYLLITQQDGYVLTSPLYATAVGEHVPHLILKEYTSSTPVQTHLETIVKKHHLSSIGYEEQNLTVSEWKYIKKYLSKLRPIKMNMMRIKKTRQEVEHIRKAAAIADVALKKILSEIKPGKTETEIVFLLENEMRKSASDIAFPTIVAFGKNAATPHHKSNATKLKKHDLILIDFGAVAHEYRSDMTRAFFMGKATVEQEKAYEAVLESQKSAVTFIKSSLKSKKKIKASDVDAVARDYLLSYGYPSIPHSLGHGIGLEVHEAPRLSPRSKEVLEEGMVFSIEPGVYFPGNFGIRIEDLYTIQDHMLIRLTHAPSRLLEL